MQRIAPLFLLFLWLCGPVFAHGTENVFYVLHSKPQEIKALAKTLASVEKHAGSIDTVISQAFQIDENGKLTGYLNQELIDLSRAYRIKLMAMVTNKGFDQEQVHAFLLSSRAQELALASLLRACEEYRLSGVQFDFEMVALRDKGALTRFYQQAAHKLHHAGFAVSFAIIPAFVDTAGTSAFLQKTYRNWSGAYDLQALGKSADFVTIMAYNQHPEGTVPGPLASIAWVSTAIKNALRYVPADKLSLGIPTYSVHWYTGALSAAHPDKIVTQRMEISFSNAARLIKENHSPLLWDRQGMHNYSIFERNWLNEYVYLEDADSFRAKLALAKRYHLRGISVFRLGTEDTRIWGVL